MSAFDAIPAELLRRPNTYALIADAIIALIQAQQLKPGDPIPTERELMERFGTGRSSVREAIRVLESKGVIHGDRAGFCVSDVHAALSNSFELVMRLTDGTVRDFMELRRTLEVENARVAAGVRSAADVDALRAANERLESALQAAEDDDAAVTQAADADLDLHIRIAEAAGNRMVVVVMQAMRVVANRTYRTSIAMPDIRNEVVGQHERIISAIAAQDADAASAAMREHVLHVEAQLGELMDHPLYEQ